MTGADTASVPELRQRLEDVHTELLTIDEDLPEPLTLAPVTADVERTVALYQLLERQDSSDEYANL